MKFRKYTQEQFIEAIASSQSIAQALTKLGVAPHGGNYKVAQNYIEQLGLDISHMSGQAWNKGKQVGPKRELNDYLTNQCSISSFKLKNRLLSEKILERRCQNCQLSEWLDKPIPLELHHIDGNPKNNQLDNLSLLCPNCHSLTDNYRGKNKK